MVPKSLTVFENGSYITSDCDAVSLIFEQQKYAKSHEEAVAYVLKAGMLNSRCSFFLVTGLLYDINI